MWIFTKVGFVSVVQHQKFPDLLIVRARCEADIRAIVGWIDGANETTGREHRIIRGGGTDYAWRVNVHRGHFARAIADLIDALDYGNFKGEIHEQGDELRDNAYAKIWETMVAFQLCKTSAPGEERR